MKWFGILILGFAACFAGAPTLKAQSLPKDQIELVVPSGTGGGIDTIARVLSKFMQTELKTTIVVENKPGSQGLLGTKFVAKAKPDGSTLLIAASISDFPVTYRDPGVDVLKDLEFVSHVMRASEIFAIHAGGSYDSIADLVAISKKDPQKLNYASYGSLLGLFGAIINDAAGISATELKFNTSQDAAKAVAAGDADYFLASVATLRPWLAAGKIKMLGVTTSKRSEFIPDVPTLGELGVKLDDLGVWIGVFAPKGTPRPIVDQLNQVIRDFVRDPGTVALFGKIGFDAYASSPEEFRAAFKSEQDRLIAIAKKIGVQPQ